jgi:hypothetical protein
MWRVKLKAEGFYQSKGLHEKNQKNWGCLKKYKCQFIFFKHKKIWGCFKNRMPTLMVVPFLKHPPNIGEKKYDG